METFAERLRRLRTDRGMTLDALAERAGTSKQVLSRYETGLRVPKISMVEKLAEALNVSLSELSGDDRPDQRGPLLISPAIPSLQDAIPADAEPDLEAAALKAAETLLKYNVTAAPVDPMRILKSLPDTFVVTFTEMAGSSGLDNASLVTLFGAGSQDAVTYILDGRRYMIAYNQRLPHYMLQIAFARELGHILLSHDHSARPEAAQTSEALCFARHLLCPRPLIAALRDAGILLSVELLGNLTGCYGRILAGIRKTPGAHVPALTNRKIRRQMARYIELISASKSSLTKGDESIPADFGTYMEGYIE